MNEAVPSFQPVISCAAYCLAHAPELVRYGSKPRREIASDPSFEHGLSAALREFSAAERYAPNRAFIGRLAPEDLAQLPRPWFASPGDNVAHETHTGATSAVPFGEILPQAAFYSWIDQQDLEHEDGDGRGDDEKPLEPGETILICDVGGGTTDLTLIRVEREGDDGEVRFHRIAVGEHLILG